MSPVALRFAGEQLGFPLLSALVWTPILAAALALFAPSERIARWIGVIGAALCLGLAGLISALGDWSAPGFQLVERREWIDTLHVQYLLGVDGFSSLMLTATALLGLGVHVASWTSSLGHARAWHALLLGLEGALFGVFTALDLVLFFAFWELALPSVYFLVSLWGVGPERRFAALKYTLLMLAGGLCILVAILLLGAEHRAVTDALAFDLPSLLTTPISADKQRVVFILMLIGFGVKIPLWPLHSWLPTLAMEGPPAGLAMVIGLKVGLYAMVRFALPLAPAAAVALSGWTVGLGLVGFVVAALVALSQSNLRRQVAWLSMCHAGLLTVAMGAGGAEAMQGLMLQLANLALAAGGTLLALGFLYQRRGTTDLAALGGVASAAPRLAGFTLVLGLSEIGLPGTGGFVAEWQVLVGLARLDAGLALVGVLGGLVGAAAFSLAFRRAFWGPVRGEGPMPDLRPREAAVLGVLAIALILGGVRPGPALRLTEAPARAVAERLQAQGGAAGP